MIYTLMKAPVESSLKQLSIDAEIEGAVGFSDNAFEYAEVTSYKSRDTLAFVSVEDFLKLAEQGFSEEKYQGCKALIQNGNAFSSLPFLAFTHDGKGSAQVVGHEGRHRAMVLRDQGIEQIPVVLKSYSSEGGMGIRWGSQDEGSFDALDTHGQVMPKTLKAEDGDFVCMMPQSAIFKMPEKVKLEVDHVKSPHLKLKL